MLVQAALPPEVGQLRGVPTQASGFHLQLTTAHSVEVECKLQATGVPVQLPPGVPPLGPPVVVPPVPAGVVEPPLPPAPTVPCPPVPPAADGTVVPPVPPSAPASGVGHMQAAYAPAEVQVCAPCWPVGHAHSTLAPATHLAASLPAPHAPRNATETNQGTIHDLLHMGWIVAPFAPSGNSGVRRSGSNVSDYADCLNPHPRWLATVERFAVQRCGRRQAGAKILRRCPGGDHISLQRLVRQLSRGYS